MKKKIIFLGMTTVSLITAGVVIPLVLLKNEDKKQKEDVKDIVIYADKLKSLKTKTVTISATSGSVTSNKQNILNAIKKLDNFPQIPNGISLDIKDSNEKLIIGGISIILVVKKENETDIEIEGFKVKRSKNATELASDSIKNVKKILDDKSLKLVTIENVQAKVGATGVDYKIIEKLKETIGSTNLDGVTISVKADSIDANIVNVGEGIGFIITLSKGEATPVEISNWKVKRIESNVELATKSINNVKKILDDKGSKLVTIENIQAKVGASGVAAKIIAKLQEAIGSANLEGVTISVKADTANADIIDTGSGIGFIITLLKGSAPSEEIINWKVIRTKPKVEQDKDAINNVKKILDDKNSKLVTIINVQAKVGASGVANKIITKLEEAIGSDNLEGVIIDVKADTTNADIIDTGSGIGFIITLSKGKATPEEISNWKVKRTKLTVEQDKDAINNVKKILDDKSSKLVKIENVQAKVGSSGVANKIVAKLEEAIGSSNLEGVTISVKADTTNADIIDTGSGIGFIITLSKGSAQPEEIINWKVKRTKVRIELDTDAINNVKTILDSKDPKLVTIENVQAKVGASGVALKIVAKLEETIGSDNLEGVIIDVKADTANADIIDTGQGIGFIITLSKRSAQLVEITDWKVKRTRSNVEQATNSINNVRTILDNKDLKLVTIENVQAKVGASGVPAKIIAKLEEAIGSDNLEGVIIDVKADTTNADIIDTGQGIGFIITLLKGEAQSVEITNWKVKRTKLTVELDTESVNNVKTILNNDSSKLVIIENVQAKVGARGVANKIIAKLIEAIGSGNLEGVTISVKADTANADIIDTGNGISFIITLSKGEATPEEITNWKVKRTKLTVELDTESINNVKTILDSKDPKLVVIENLQAKVGVSGVANKIIAKLIETIGSDNLESVTISVKADTINADIIDTGQGIGFIITLSKGEATPEEITNWKVKRTKLTVELDTESINNVKTILDNKDLKLVTIINAEAKVEASGVPAKIIAKLEESIGLDNLEGVIINVRADTTNADIIDTGQGIGFIITLLKGEAQPIDITNWKVKREITADEDILAIKNILDSKTGEDLKIILSSNSSGNIIGKVTNKNAIEIELKKLIDPLNIGEDPDHSSLRGTRIEVSMSSDALISKTFQDIIVSISKTGGTTLTTRNIFQVRREFTIDEKIKDIKRILDYKNRNDLEIVLSSDSTGNIIGNIINKNAIERKLRILIDPLNTNGDLNHPSLKGTTISISMSSDAPISIDFQDIIVSISKPGGTTLSTAKTFQVKRDFTADEDIKQIEISFRYKSGDNLIITLPSDSSGNIIGNIVNKNAIERELRILINPSNINGDPNYPSLRGTTISISMISDAPISTSPQDIIVSISKPGGKTLRTKKTFRVKRNLDADEDIKQIKNILESEYTDSKIILPSDSSGNIIGNIVNKNAIERKLRILIDPLNTNGDPGHPSLKGTTISISMSSDAPISTQEEEIFVSISKPGGKTLRPRRTFVVTKVSAEDEDTLAIKNILESKTGDDLIITLPSDSSGHILSNNKNAILKRLRKLIDPSNTNGDPGHASLRGTIIDFEIRGLYHDSILSTIPQEIFITVKKSGAQYSYVEKNIFQVVKKDE